jgi:hypothetical protein
MSVELAKVYKKNKKKLLHVDNVMLSPENMYENGNIMPSSDNIYSVDKMLSVENILLINNILSVKTC